MARRHTRAPVQARAIARRDALLDAAARLLERGGWDALTTNALAEEAGTAVGTVYDYFRDKDAVVEALLARHGERLAAAIEAAIAGGGEDPLAVGDAVVEAFAQVWLREPGYQAVWLSAQVSGLLARTGAAWAAAHSARIEALLLGLAPGAPRATLRVVATTAVHLVSGLLLAAVTAKRALRRPLIEETKLVLRAYVASRLAGLAEAGEVRASRTRRA